MTVEEETKRLYRDGSGSLFSFLANGSMEPGTQHDVKLSFCLNKETKVFFSGDKKLSQMLNMHG